MSEAIRVFERVRIYDSTTRWAAPRLAAVARNGQVARRGPGPAWLDAALADDTAL